MKHWPSILIITISALLMQWHSIAFWLEYAGYTGVGFSLALEVVALWLWWQGRSGLAVVASALLVAGPLFQMSAPVMNTLMNQKNNSALISSYKSEIQQLSNSLNRYDQNSAKRIGWSSRIDRAQRELQEAREKLRGLIVQATPDSPTRLYMIVLMQALALMIIMRSQIIAVKELPIITDARSKQPKQSKVKTALPVIKNKNNESEPGEKTTVEKTPFDIRVIALAKKMKERLPSYSGKQRSLADDIKIRPADISLVFNHEERVKNGKEVVSERALVKMENAMVTL